MASSLFPIFLTNLLIFLWLSHVIISSSAGLFRPNPLCHDKESSALLQFKESMVIDVSASSSPLAYSKLESWKHEVNDHQDNVSSCCLWDGVHCNDLTGHVIGLDLSSSYLSGFFSSNCSLFQLHHLVNLNLADNNFHNSRVPSSLANFSGLTHLNLSFSRFSGQIPPETSKLSKLSLLDISSNLGLILKNPDLGSLVQNLTNLEYLHLDEVEISSEMPMILANMSSLKSLVMSDCSLSGDFPKLVLQLPYLETLVLSNNPDLQGNLPDFNSSSPLQSLDISETSFSGKLPASIGSVTSLQKIDIGECGFSGQVPASLRNLRHLVYLSLSDNYFVVENSYSLAWIGELTKLSVLGLSNIHLGEVPAYLANLTHLAELYLESCGIVGQIPSLILEMKHLRALGLSSNELEGSIPEWITQVTQLGQFYARGNKLQGQIPSSIYKLIHLIEIDLSVNKLHGPIPESIFQLKNLKSLDLARNKLSGPVDLDMFLKLKELTLLILSKNKLSLISKSNNTAIALQKFTVLVLESCNLQRFPNFLRDQDELEWLDLSYNGIHGLIPKWIWSINKYILENLSLRGNLLTGLEHNPISFPWVRVGFIDLSYNRLEGPSLPTPPPSTIEYDVSRNNFSGEIPPSFCSYKSLKVLDLSHNNLSGMLPSCLGNIVTSTQVLNLAGNKLRGQVFHIRRKDCELKQLKLNQNQLEGKLPRSLTQCAQLHFLDIGNNKISGKFPYWLGSLQELRVLSLRSNNLTGVLQSQRSHPQFRKLQIIDISENNFSGQLPTQYFLDWKAMKEHDTEEGTYMDDYGNYSYGSFIDNSPIQYTISITNKGIQLDYSEIPESFVVIHFSGNRFEGGIPEVLGDLKGLHLLNLSNNNLNGSIPRSIGNLRNLESLDLSQNNLSGEIPQQLAQLNFLEVFNVSYNHLEGPIPRGKQFETFQNDSYLGNTELCGTLLMRKCDLSGLTPSPSPGDGGSGSWFEFGWEPVVIGYGCGIPLGVLIVFIVDIMRHGWLVKTFRIKQSRNTRRGRTQRRRNRFA